MRLMRVVSGVYSKLTEGIDDEEEVAEADGEGGDGGVSFGDEMVSDSSGVVASGGAFEAKEGFRGGLV